MRGQQPVVQRHLHSTGAASRLAALLLPQILPVFSVVAPCQPGASPLSVQRWTCTTGCSAQLRGFAVKQRYALEMALIQLVLASAAYAAGGLFMKQSAGLSRPRPTIAFLALFAGGATLQAAGMKSADLGVSYIFVLGVEALMTVLLSMFYLHESYRPSRIAAIALVIVGILWLRRT